MIVGRMVRAVVSVLLCTACLTAVPSGPAYGGPPGALPPGAATMPQGGGRGVPWLWPVPGSRVSQTWMAPPTRYAAGHRGIDLAPVGPARVRAPADGVVAFVGTVAGRALVTIDHGGGVVTTLEPVSSARTIGEAVRAGDDVGGVSTGGHAMAGTVHFGVRVDGEYVNPLLLLGGLRRAVLLPCCR